jgi:RHS repeat-associated protein
VVFHYPFLTLKERDSETGLDYFINRYYSSTQGRFTGADPMGGHTEDPQTLNRYTYVRNNPGVLTDPKGLDFYLQCKDNSATCQDGRVGTTDNKGSFTTTLITNDKNGRLVDQRGNVYTTKITGQGVSFNGAGSKEYIQGVFLNGTNATTIAGSGSLTGFTFNFTSSNLDVNQTAKGTFSFNGTAGEAARALEQAGYTNSHWDDFNIYHPSTDEYNAIDYRSPGEGDDARNSGHFTLHEPVIYRRSPTLAGIGPAGEVRFRIKAESTVPVTGDVHFGEHNPWNGGAFGHSKELTRP